MSQTQTLELTCPCCRRGFAAELWTVVNVDTEPHLKKEVRNLEKPLEISS
ncbi:hypothetical protein HYR99_07965 [Candidatus Poribacteria bacterium]|nr:hypothetical protein [Candidatus Poribacteria bacterium]